MQLYTEEAAFNQKRKAENAHVGSSIIYRYIYCCVREIEHIIVSIKILIELKVGGSKDNCASLRSIN